MYITRRSWSCRPGPRPPTVRPAHDDRSAPADSTASYAAAFDAWNRMVKLMDGADTVQENEYDGRRYRTHRKDYAAGVLAETRHIHRRLARQAVIGRE